MILEALSGENSVLCIAEGRSLQAHLLRDVFGQSKVPTALRLQSPACSFLSSDGKLGSVVDFLT
jgi:hypothetical protein